MEKEQLDEIRTLGSLAYTPEQVAQVVGVSATSMHEACNDPDSDVGRAYWAGWYETDIQVRKSIIDLAKRGSSPAQAEVRRIMAEAETRRFYEQ